MSAATSSLHPAFDPEHARPALTILHCPVCVQPHQDERVVHLATCALMRVYLVHLTTHGKPGTIPWPPEDYYAELA